jgi:spermidine/putrescine transport system substrate-binding protein
VKRLVLAAGLAALLACGGKPEAPTAAPAKAPAATKKLNLYIWSAYVPKQVLDDFTKKTGIAVRYDTYDSNEPVLEKLQSGVADYDLVVPSDYMVRILIQQKLIQTLDKTRLPNVKNLDPRFLDQKFDKGNVYSLPYVWGTTGYAYDKAKAKIAYDGWAPLFDPANKGRILMLDDMRECFAVALKSMGKSLNSTDAAVIKQAADLLKKQKPLVKTYNSGDFGNILAAGDVDVAHGYNGQLAKVVAKEPQRFAYVLPKEGATIWMDNVCIPKSAKNLDSAYAFLDYVMEPEPNAKIVNAISYASANVAARKLIEPAILNDPAIYPAESSLTKCEFIEDVGEATTLYDRYWTEIKAQ